ELVWRGDGFVRDVAFSPDGRSLACADSQSMWLYETATARERLRIPNPAPRSEGSYRLQVEFSRDGRRLAALHERGVGVWDAATGRLVQTFACPRAEVTSLAFSPDSRTLATASWDTTVLLWAIRDTPAESIRLGDEAAATAWAD